MDRPRWLGRVAGLATALALAGTAVAHGASLGGRESGALAVPTWLLVLTGGAAVGASFLLASLATDRVAVRAVHEWRSSLRVPRRPLALAGRLAGLVALAIVVVAGTRGPPGTGNAAILLVWVGWWAGLVMVAYLLGNPWRALNPARTVAALLPGGRLRYPDRLGAWPSVVALLALVYLEIVSPLAERPGLLVAAVSAYLVASVLGAVAFGTEPWFGRADPVARVFDTYGRVGPLRRDPDGDGFTLSLPGAGLADADLDASEVAFVVALLWGTTFDGAVATPAWADLVAPVVDAGAPPRLVYLVGLSGGFALFYAAFRLAARAARRTAPTYLSVDAVAGRFAATLLPIAAGYHFAHYFDYFLRLSPSLVESVLAPLSAASLVLTLPDGLGAVSLFAVLVGHVLAVGVAHAVAFDTFPGRLQAIRSQYPLTLVMVAYTVTSLWLLSRPTVVPPYL
jgi:hypothetical protein